MRHKYLRRLCLLHLEWLQSHHQSRHYYPLNLRLTPQCAHLRLTLPACHRPPLPVLLLLDGLSTELYGMSLENTNGKRERGSWPRLVSGKEPEE